MLFEIIESSAIYARQMKTYLSPITKDLSFANVKSQGLSLYRLAL